MPRILLKAAPSLTRQVAGVAFDSALGFGPQGAATMHHPANESSLALLMASLLRGGRGVSGHSLGAGCYLLHKYQSSRYQPRASLLHVNANSLRLLACVSLGSWDANLGLWLSTLDKERCRWPGDMPLEINANFER